MEILNLLHKIGNPFTKAILRSPRLTKMILRTSLHSLAGRNITLITFSGRQSGKSYTIPVYYLREGDNLTIVCMRKRTWWRNLRKGAVVTLRLKGQDVTGRGEVIEDDQRITAGLITYLQKLPNYTKKFDGTFDSNGQPKTQDVARIAQTILIVNIKLT